MIAEAVTFFQNLLYKIGIGCSIFAHQKKTGFGLMLPETVENPGAERLPRAIIKGGI
jgi:hypothetical protein